MLNWEEYASVARQVAAEGCVLIKNDNNALPIKNEKVAVFGINAFHYYKSGLGSGGMVNTRYVVSILDALKAEEGIEVDKELIDIYEAWIKENPFEQGLGWGNTPWSQNEMPLSKEVVEAANERNDMAVILIGRTAGEDQDNSCTEKSFLLSQAERDMLSKVCSTFKRTVVLLNVGNIIDMNWVKEYNPGAVMYVWQGGQEGGNGVADVVTGRVTPCGKLTDTIAESISDYPSDNQFGDLKKNYYEEDIYVGYRYFSSIKEADKKVLYPFGYGLSYTTFSVTSKISKVLEDKIVVEATVTNTGAVAGKEVVQVYVEAPQGKLGKPLRVLTGFDKTDVLEPGKSETLVIDCGKEYFASFDDDGRTGHESCFVLEEGTYKFYAGTDVQKAELIGSYEESELKIVSQCTKAYSPVESFERFALKADADGNYSFAKETVNPTPYNAQKEVCDFPEIKQTTGTSYQLKQVLNKEITMEEFIAQLSDDDLMHLQRGEGMCSMKVTPGTASAFAGLTPRLKELGIPALCCADGPSGIRMDCGTKAFSLPNGALIGGSFDLKLTKKLFEYVGQELRQNKVDTLLGPGINIHRHPLNGRNFEYFSEDPFLTGKMCVAQLQGMHEYDVTGTIKHFCANNQEKNRYCAEGVISERALREIYLKGFEIAVKEGNARSVMTTYGPVNGLWTAGSYDLCTTILRKDWGFKGIVMSDWWAMSNWYGEEPDHNNVAAMVRAQNDLFMLCPDNIPQNDIDNLKPEFENGRVTRAMLQRNAYNTLTFALGTPAMERLINKSENEEDELEQDDSLLGSEDFACFEIKDDMEFVEFDPSKYPQMKTEDGLFFGLVLTGDCFVDMGVTYSTVSAELAQIPISIYLDNMYRGALTLRGTSGATVEDKKELQCYSRSVHYFNLIFKANELDIKKFTIYKK